MISLVPFHIIIIPRKHECIKNTFQKKASLVDHFVLLLLSAYHSHCGDKFSNHSKRTVRLEK